MAIQITMLSAMASPDFEVALHRHVSWGLQLLDLKDGIFGKALLDLTDEDAQRAAEMIRQRALAVHCLSSGLFHADVEQGRERFVAGLDDQVQRLIALAGVFRPRVVRLLGATTSRRDCLPDAVAHIEQRHPWLITAYQDAIDAIAEAGFTTTIENEVQGCILGTPAEVLRLFRLLDRPGRVEFTWDVQNMWQAGTWPDVGLYEELQEVTGLVHFKGGQSAAPGGPLRYRCALEESSYDVRGLVRALIGADRVKVICLNPPHGEPRPGVDETDRLERDLAFLRALVSAAG